MPSDYKKIAEENIKKYGTNIDRYGPVLLTNLYSDRTHFVYELLQNAEDARTKQVSFHLFKDRLEVYHNGRPFNDDDIRGICGLVEGTKKDDLTQIGKFGIGFKSVYAYTTLPKVFSGDESFCIKNYVQPQCIEKVELKDDETLFVFPFNHNEVSSEQAFKDISERLRKLGSQTLLFLNNIEEINWDIEGEESGDYIRDNNPQGGNSRRVYIVSKEGSEKDKEEEWLIFERPVKSDKSDTPEVKVEVAFKVAKKGGKTKEGEEGIIPADDSCLVVFFPTEKETHLEFLIQGPYKTTPARDNIPKEDKWNKDLIKETALLVAESISKIKELGLLTVDFLNILPISEADFPENHMFRPIYDAVLNKLKSDEKLLPANDGGYVSVKQAFLARGKDLINLLGTEQLSLLFKKQNAQWLSSSITQDKNPELRTYLMEKLEVTEVTPEKFANQFSEEFIKEQDDDWVIKFYIFLKDQKALWKKKENYWPPAGPLRNKPFIRLEDNSHVAPFDGNGKPNVYLPSNYSSSFSTVKKKIAEDEQAREFLKELGLREPDKIAEVIEFILPKYRKDDIKVSKEENLQDVKKIFQALKSDFESKKNELTEQLKEIPFLWSTNNAGNTMYLKPAEIYLPQTFTNNDDLETYFEGNPDAYFLDEIYKDVVKKEQLLELGCLDKIHVNCRESDDGEYIIIHKGRGNHRRGVNRFDPYCEVDGLEHALEHITKEKALIIWKMLKRYHQSIYGTVESSNYQDYRNPNKNEQASKMGNLVRDNKWLPDKQGNFHKPSELLLSDLPDDFEKESVEAKSLAEKLGFKKDIEQEYLSQLSETERKILNLQKD